MKVLEHPYYCSFKRQQVFSQEDGEGSGSYIISSYENSLESVTKVAQGPNITSIHNFLKSAKAYLVWIEYSTGDSFGSHTRSEVLPIALLKYKKDAKTLAGLTSFWNPQDEYDSTKHQEYKGSFFKSSDGQEVNLTHAPWTGYFEMLEAIQISEVKII
jgi:hypothetical protein